MRCSPIEFLGAALIARRCAAIVAVCAALSVSAPRGAHAGLAVTVYNDDLALVREERALQISEGSDARVELTDVPARIDPTSVHFRSLTAPDKVTVLEQNFVYDLIGGDRLLEKSLDREIQVLTRQGGTWSGRLMSFDGGSLVVAAPQGRMTIVARDEVESVALASGENDLVTRPTLVWLLSNTAGRDQNVEIEYLTGGLSWHAEYAGVLDKDETSIDLAAWVSLDNHSGKTYTDANLQVVAGTINRARGPQPVPMYADGMVREKAQAGFEAREFFEYHLYALPRKTTIRDRESKQLSLFPNVRTKAAKMFTYEAAKDPERVLVSVSFDNREAAGLGIPLPGGVIRVYKDDGAGGVGLVGEDRIEHTPKDEEVEVSVGKAFDIVAERNALETKTLGPRSREDSVEIRFRNHKASAVEILVKEPVWGDWQITSSSVPSERKNATTVQFRVAVPANGETTLAYTVRTRW